MRGRDEIDLGLELERRVWFRCVGRLQRIEVILSQAQRKRRRAAAPALWCCWCAVFFVFGVFILGCRIAATLAGGRWWRGMLALAGSWALRRISLLLKRGCGRSA